MFNKYNRIIVSGVLVLSIPLLVGCTKQENKATNRTTIATTEAAIKSNTEGKLIYEGVDITPGAVFNYRDINKEPKIFTVASCAFEGEDNVYTYEDIEITVNVNKETNTETIYSVYIINDNFVTPEGLKLGSKVDDMHNLLGTEEDEFNGVYTYKKNNMTIKITTKANIIFSMEYTLIIN